MQDKQEHTFFFQLLISPRFRLWRHVLLILMVFFISLNQTWGTYESYIWDLGYKLCWILLLIFLSYILVGYFNLYVLVPRYLLTKKYITYGVSVVLLIALLIVSQDVIEYMGHSYWNLTPDENSVFYAGNSIFVDFLFAYCVAAFCIIGISVTALLKQWMVEKQRVSTLESEYLQSEVEELKGQISPDFLLKILNKTGNLSKTDAEKASDMLMRLSKILRYQLYDSAREEVLLNSEIVFLRNYLDLYKQYDADFEYDISVKGDSNKILLPPLLFMPIIQCIIETEKVNQHISILFIIYDNKLSFMCSFQQETFNNYSCIYNSEKRLKFLFPDRYKLEYDKRNNMVFLELSGL